MAITSKKGMIFWLVTLNTLVRVCQHLWGIYCLRVKEYDKEKATKKQVANPTPPQSFASLSRL
jgi:hypothetical protein